MIEMPVSIVLRSFNEAWALRDTLPALAGQHYRKWELIAFDSGSSDDSVELLRRAHPRHLVQMQPQEYRPGRVLNQAMELARHERVIFLNADATPQGRDWLGPLVDALADPQVAAVYGRQIPRPDCAALVARDYDRCFGPQRESAGWEHFFSMVSSGLRRDAWARRGFRETLQYSEDDEYTRWCRAAGYRIAYCPESVVMHSHNYTPRQAYKRSFGEAWALAAGRRGSRQVLALRGQLLGWLRDASGDLRYCCRMGRLREWPQAAAVRWQQRRGQRHGSQVGAQIARAEQKAASEGDSQGSGSRQAFAAPGETRLRRTSARPIETGSAPPDSFSPDFPVPALASSHLGVATLVSPDRIAARRSLSAPSAILRFTLDGDDALERDLTLTCARVLSGVRALIPAGKLEAVLLGDGYGRGEGGVRRGPAGDRPYNDLDFTVAIRGNRHLSELRYRRRLEVLGEILTHQADAEVEFKITSRAEMANQPVSMFSYDLKVGHRLLYELAGAPARRPGIHPHRRAERIPPAEATRLLMNRCSGLLFARADLARTSLTPTAADFVQRNIAKAQLACGDAVLAAFSRYHWSCRERHRRLEQLTSFESWPWLAALLRHHAIGMEFKLHPQADELPHATLVAQHREVTALALQCWLWLESRRLGREFPSARAYAEDATAKCPDTSSLLNLLLNFRANSYRWRLRPNPWRHPRQRLFHALALLLWEPTALTDPALRRRLALELNLPADHASEWLPAYRALWQRVQ